MAGQLEITKQLQDYVRGVSLREDPLLSELRGETSGIPALDAMVTSPEEGQLLALLVKATGARRVLEIGTFTGYGTICMARALPPDGTLVTCDNNQKWVDLAASYWRRAGVDDHIESRLGDAQESIAELLENPGPGIFDLVFVDADKVNYRRYYEGALALLRPGGLVIVDNTLFFGRVVDPEATDPDTLAISELNRAMYEDDRVDLSVLPMADGITLCWKRP